jgi:type IV pilus assembly protein PilO
MTLQLSKNEKKILLFGLLVITLIFVFVYFQYLQPLKTTFQNKENQFHSAQQSYQAILSQQTEDTDAVVENSQFLQRRLPVEPLLNQFILDLEKAETMSNSLILNMGFGEQEKDEETESTALFGLEEQSESTNSEVTTDNALPTGINKISVTLSIQSQSYFDLEKFIETIENSDRIVTVESINFSGASEVTSIDQVGQSIQPLNYQVLLTLYYMPGLEDLQNELPKVESGEPANKRNPFNQYNNPYGNGE